MKNSGTLNQTRTPTILFAVQRMTFRVFEPPLSPIRNKLMSCIMRKCFNQLNQNVKIILFLDLPLSESNAQK